MRRAAGAAVACLAAVTAAVAAPPAADGFALRIVKLGGVASDPQVRAHLDFALAQGFNAVWVPSGEAGRWTRQDAPAGPFLRPDFEALASACRERGVRVVVSINPVADSGGRFVFSDPRDVKAARAFVTLLRRRAWVNDVALSFDDQPRELVDLADVERYGRNAAPAHIDLARQVLRGAGRGGSVWLCGAAYSDWHLDDAAHAAYAGAFFAGLPRLPKRVGLVWTGPDTISESITRADLDRVRALARGRPLLLYDNYPVNDDPDRMALALILGPLRRRDPDLHRAAAAYLSCPMSALGASRLPLLTVADYLRDPAGYDPDASWARAIERLAGDDAAALEALRTQALEWGGWVNTLNYHHFEDANPRALARRLDRPALMATWGYTLRRYDERIRDARGIRDAVFRDDLIEAMTRTLAVARALALVRELRGVARDGPPRDAAAIHADIERLRRDLATSSPNARRAVDVFLEAAGIAVPPGG